VGFFSFSCREAPDFASLLPVAGGFSGRDIDFFSVFLFPLLLLIRQKGTCVLGFSPPLVSSLAGSPFFWID